MALSLQQKKMREICTLLNQDLGYIFGEREPGPNGIKKQFLIKSASFLRRLGTDIGLTKMKVYTNPSGIACSGEVSLFGMWDDGNGVFFEITQHSLHNSDLLYREIKHLHDYSGGCNQWLPLSVFTDADYARLCDVLHFFKKEGDSHAA